MSGSGVTRRKIIIGATCDARTAGTAIASPSLSFGTAAGTPPPVAPRTRHESDVGRNLDAER